jgi:2-oxoglutarate ferredoxin oxidoreductase subunit gamma
VRKEVRITGYGGQGVILSAHVLGKAATLFEGLHATMTQAFGPEARGSACSAQIVISDEPVDYPYVKKVDVLVAMSQEGFDLYIGGLKDDGILLYEEDLVDLGEHEDRPNSFGVPATRIAEGLGRRIVLNMAMLGFVAAMTDLVSAESMKESIKDSVPPGTEGLNLQAFEGGHGYHHDQERAGDRGRDIGDPVGA